MSKVLITRSKLDGLANTISTKSGVALPLTIAQMDTAVDSIVVGSGVDTSSDTVDAAHLLDGYTAHDSTGAQIVGSYVAPTFTTQSKTATPTTSSQTIQPDSGYDGLSSVTVDAMPTGTAGTPTATKGSVSNHSVSVTPSVTNTTGYITGSTKTGTAVTVSASELVSGSETKTANGTYDVTNLASLVVNVASSSKNVQTAQSTSRSTSTSGTQVISLTCSTAGKYTVRWSTFRSSTSGTWGSCLYIGGSAYETMQTTGWNNHIQNRELTNVQINANQAVAVYVQSRGTNYYGYVGTLTIIQTA